MFLSRIFVLAHAHCAGLSTPHHHRMRRVATTRVGTLHKNNMREAGATTGALLPRRCLRDAHSAKNLFDCTSAAMRAAVPTVVQVSSRRLTLKINPMIEFPASRALQQDAARLLLTTINHYDPVPTSRRPSASGHYSASEIFALTDNDATKLKPTSSTGFVIYD